MDRRKNLSRLQEADQRYWRDVVRFRWLAVGSYFAMVAGGVLPYHMPWFVIAAAVLVANNVAYTLYRIRHKDYGWYQDLAGYLDIVSIALILVSIGTVNHHLWVAFVLVIPAVANFKGLRYNVVFTAFVVLSFGAAYALADVFGAGGASVSDAVVISVLLSLTGINSVMISANNYRLREVIELQASTDPLTGLANRRVLFEALEADVNERSMLAVLMIDLDDFKLLNDQKGHIAADHVLARVAELLAEAAPGRALAARYGGDEFVLLVEVTAPYEARSIAERLVRAGRDRAGVGLSAGVALCPLDAATPAQALHIADEHLRLAKAGGKQRVSLGKAA
jgi:diguanylate cyclase (GGDEF)-like protein